MRRDAARRLASNEVVWTGIINTLRTGKLTRVESYKLCSEAVEALPAGGIGPAYYTKIIFLANPRHDGYIMDQWTSRSVNLLAADKPIIAMRAKNHVDPRNDHHVFERYCSFVEGLSTLLHGNKTPEDIEQCLFSTGGKHRAPWRRYVMEAR